MILTLEEFDALVELASEARAPRSSGLWLADLVQTVRPHLAAEEARLKVARQAEMMESAQANANAAAARAATAATNDE